jgi:hypothetical protein
MNVALFLEIRDEFTEHLIDTLTPFINEGLGSFYKEAVDISEKNGKNEKVLIILQTLLLDIEGWTQYKSNEETNRIKQTSGSGDYLDDLVKSVIKSNIILLTCSGTVSNAIAQSFYNTLSTSALIHRCYIECGKDAHNNPFLFYHAVDPMDLKRNQIIIEKNIQKAIARAIRKILPIGLILKEFLANSINIINEPPQVELVQVSGTALVPLAIQPGIGTGIGPEIKPESKSEVKPEIKSDKQLDKQVMKMVKTENEKSDRDKVRDLMKLEKALNSDRPSKNDFLQHGGKSRNYTHILDDDKSKSSEYSPNKKLNKSDRAVININFNSDSDAENSSAKISSKTMSPFSENPGAKNVGRRNGSKFIEEYGAATESTAQPKNNDHKKRGKY